MLDLTLRPPVLAFVATSRSLPIPPIFLSLPIIPHREGLEPMFEGDPVGKWEGDTLVIETKNFRRWALDDHHYTNPAEFRMHSDALRTVERLRWKSPTAISYTITIDDPKIFTAPWSQEFEILTKPEWEKDGLYEYVCQENNRCPGGVCAEK